MGQFYNINNNNPRFIEVYGTYKNPAKEGWKEERDVKWFFVNWNEVTSIARTLGWWTVLHRIEREFLIEYAQENGGKDCGTPISTLWVLEDFDHFVRRVNKGLAITMIEDGDK